MNAACDGKQSADNVPEKGLEQIAIKETIRLDNRYDLLPFSTITWKPISLTGVLYANQLCIYLYAMLRWIEQQDSKRIPLNISMFGYLGEYVE